MIPTRDSAPEPRFEAALSVMRRYYLGLSPAGRLALIATVVGEINGLLGVSLPRIDVAPQAYEAALEALCRETLGAIHADGYGPEREETLALVRALSTDRERPLRGFVNDLAEILSLPRRKRSEYVHCVAVTPPYRISKLLLEYASKCREVDRLVGVLSKDYCAARCDKLPVGCCYILGYDLGLVPEGMLEAQALEARRTGWRPPAHEETCRYHGATGCVIALFKSPACIGYLCEGLLGHLAERYPADRVAAFLEALAVFRNCHLDRSEVFRAMDATIQTGRALETAGGSL